MGRASSLICSETLSSSSTRAAASAESSSDTRRSVRLAASHSQLMSRVAGTWATTTRTADPIATSLTTTTRALALPTTRPVSSLLTLRTLDEGLASQAWTTTSTTTSTTVATTEATTTTVAATSGTATVTTTITMVSTTPHRNSG